MACGAHSFTKKYFVTIFKYKFCVAYFMLLITIGDIYYAFKANFKRKD